MAETANPARDPEWGPTRLSIPRLEMRGELPPGLEQPSAHFRELEIEVSSPQPGDTLDIPRLGIHGTYEEVPDALES